MIPIDIADLQLGWHGCFIQYTIINSTKTVSVIGPTTIHAQRFCHFGQFQEQTTRLLLLSWYLHHLVIPTHLAN